MEGNIWFRGKVHRYISACMHVCVHALVAATGARCYTEHAEPLNVAMIGQLRVAQPHY